jgi:hypothetical protein
MVMSYRHSTLEIASALLAVGRGASYRKASIPIRPGEQNGQLIASWIRRFGPDVVASSRPSAWPTLMAVGSLRANSTESAGVIVMIAVGVADLGTPIRLWEVRAVRERGRAEWVAFYRRHGGGPAVLIVQGDPSAALAAREYWSAEPPMVLHARPRPHAFADVVGHGVPESRPAAHDAVTLAFLDRCRTTLYQRLRSRHARFRDLRQLNYVLGLMRLDLNGQADRELYVDLIRSSIMDSAPGRERSVGKAT